MPPVERLVYPKLPTALANHSGLDLPGYDLWFGFVDHVYIVPTKLDIPLFEEGLSKALQLYPHFAGQLRCCEGRWSIELTNTPILVDIDYKLDTTSDAFLDGDGGWVVQDDLSPFLNNQPMNPFLANENSPLLRLKLTFFDNETCIGVHWHHTLGDAILISRFMHAFSQFYQGLPLQHAPPTFEKYHFPAPSSSASAEFKPRVPHLYITCPVSEFPSVIVDSVRDIENLRYRFDNHDLHELRSILSSRGQHKRYLSKQDCLSAYVVAAINHNASVPMQMVTNVSSFRGIRAPFIAEDIAANMLQNVYVTVPPDMAGIAAALRDTLLECRQPEYIHNLMSVQSDIMLETANTERTFVPHLFCDDTSVVVNSNMVIDWCSAHFGYPDGTQFHTTKWSAKNFLRCFRSNPVKGDDGVWRARQSVEISMSVKADLRPKVLETFARGFQYILAIEDTKV